MQKLNVGGALTGTYLAKEKIPLVPRPPWPGYKGTISHNSHTNLNSELCYAKAIMSG